MSEIIKAYNKRRVQLDEVINNLDRALTLERNRYLGINISQLRQDIENIIYPLIDDLQLIIVEDSKNI